MNIFTYGSLMFPPVWQPLVRGSYPSQSATLKNYQRSRIRHDSYPVIVPTARAQTAGKLYRGVALTDVVRLDAFEGPLYQRVEVRVQVQGGSPVRAFAWVLKPRHARLASAHPWQAEHFAEHAIFGFMSRFLRQ